jgi:RNA polymerase sigma-70 factor, ECF subfamily
VTPVEALAATPAAAALQAVLRESRRRIVARLAAGLGLAHLALAEDALQTAVLRALEHWPTRGVPANAAGWLYRVARHEAIDALRAGGRLDPWPDDGADEATAWVAPPQTSRLTGELDDDELTLLFACCHPALSSAQQVALALRMVTGLELAPLARLLLCSEAALAQRLARAREALARVAEGPAGEWATPAGTELPPRRDAVLGVLALAFHAGARARARGEPAQASLCWEAIRLARSLAAHPAVAHADADALAAMLLLHGARLTGAVDDDGEPVPLPGQARDRWDLGLVRLGLAHLQASQRAARLSRWHLLAAVAAEHAVAPDAVRTRWAQIEQLYAALLRLDGSAAPRLSHAIALAEAGDAAAALARLDELQANLPTALAAHALAARARACERLGRVDEAVQLLDAAAARAPHPADARMLRRRAAVLLGR